MTEIVKDPAIGPLIKLYITPFRVNVETESPGTLTRERFNVILVVFFLHYLVNGVMQAIWN
jgi:hypothetical protein